MLLSKEIAVYLNLSACRYKQYVSRLLRKNSIDLTPEQFLLIDLLWNQGCMSQQAIADTIEKDKNSVAKLVDGLERKQLVRRVRDEKDRRSNLVTLTQRAEDMKTAAKEKGVSILEGIIEGISDSELKSFLSVLSQMNRNMSR